MEGVDSIIPVHVRARLPATPDAITYAVLKLLSTLDQKLAELLAEFEEHRHRDNGAGGEPVVSSFSAFDEPGYTTTTQEITANG